MLFALLATLAMGAPGAADAVEPDAQELDLAALEASLAPADHPRVVAILEWFGASDEEAVLNARSLVQHELELPWQSGDVDVASGAVSLSLGDSLRYLDPATTSAVLEDWGNPPGIENYGMIVPTDAWLYGPGSWAVILQYQQDGWIDDGDAASIDYSELLTEMKASNREDSKAREAAGLGSFVLDGWAEPPHYDSSRKVLYWAKALSDGEGSKTLNYDVRNLGRYGVLSMNAVADLDMLPTIKPRMEDLRTAVAFNESYRYADYTPGTDRAATYGLAALVAGGAGAAAMKGGAFKGIIALLLAGKKFIAVGVVALLGGLKALFGGSKSERED